MQINQLPSTSTVNSTDLLVKEQANGTTEKIAISDFVVNNLTSTATDKPLSAAQGKALNEEFSRSNITPTAAQGITISNVKVRKSGNIVVINGYATIGSTALAGMDGVLFTLPEGCRPGEYIEFFCYAKYYGNDGYYTFRATPYGNVESATGGGTFAANSTVQFISAVFIL